MPLPRAGEQRFHSGAVTGAGSSASGSLDPRSPGEHTQRSSSLVVGSGASSPQSSENGALEHCRSPSTILQTEYISRHRVPPPMGPSARAGPLARPSGKSAAGSGASGWAVGTGGGERDALTGGDDETSLSRCSTQAMSIWKKRAVGKLSHAARARWRPRNISRVWISIRRGLADCSLASGAGAGPGEKARKRGQHLRGNNAAASGTKHETTVLRNRHHHVVDVNGATRGGHGDGCRAHSGALEPAHPARHKFPGKSP
jgi:hypothetical protein